VGERISRTVRISNDLGIHLRAAGVLVQVAGRFTAEVWVERHRTPANGKSIMSVLSLAAGRGSELEVSAEGDDAHDAVNAIVDLIENEFEEMS
jgi:phosphotransferase system HPr (HPr) family protein